VRGKLVEEVARAKAVRYHDVRLGEEAAAADRDQVRVARAAADKGDSWSAVAVVGRGESALAQALDDGVPDGGRTARVTAGEDGDRDAVAAAGRGGPRGGRLCVVAAHTPDAVALCFGGGGGVRLGMTGRDQCVPRLRKVSLGVRAALPAKFARLGHRLHGGRHRRGDEHDVRPGRDERGQPALGDLSAAQHDDAAAVESQADGISGVGQRRRLGHGGAALLVGKGVCRAMCSRSGGDVRVSVDEPHDHDTGDRPAGGCRD
jgi:hypothetical protein